MSFCTNMVCIFTWKKWHTNPILYKVIFILYGYVNNFNIRNTVIYLFLNQRPFKYAEVHLRAHIINASQPFITIAKKNQRNWLGFFFLSKAEFTYPLRTDRLLNVSFEKLFGFSSEFNEIWWSCSYPCVLTLHQISLNLNEKQKQKKLMTHLIEVKGRWIWPK